MRFVTLIYSPFPTHESARAAATALLEQRLAACCNLLPGAESLYHWEGKLTTSTETILIAKTTGDYSNRAIALIGQMHPHQCPAILAFSTQSTKEYEKWVKANLGA